ncbi:MAG: hypothetical protein AB8G99_15450 [Planctomycetaceae bacterium]
MLSRLKSSFSRLTDKGTRRRKQNRLSSEPVQALEDRALLAGNVLVSFSASGNLTLKGDNFNNAVRVDPVPGGIRVTGLPDVNGAPTTVGNGQPVAVFAGDQFARGNLKVQMKGGNDAFISTLTVDKNVNINMGSGSDVVGIANSLVGKNLKLNMGSAGTVLADTVEVLNIGVGGNASIKGGNGSHNVQITNSFVNKKLNVNLGGGNDILDINGGGAPKFSFNGGSGTDSFFLSPDGGGSVPSKGFEFFGV